MSSNLWRFFGKHSGFFYVESGLRRHECPASETGLDKAQWMPSHRYHRRIRGFRRFWCIRFRRGISHILLLRMAEQLRFGAVEPRRFDREYRHDKLDMTVSRAVDTVSPPPKQSWRSVIVGAAP